jgi:3-oxoacid CoA-transferase
VVFRKAARNFN